MASGMQTVIYPVKDVESAKKVYTTLLGTPPAYDSAYYVGWNIGGQDIGLDPNGHRQGMTAPLPARPSSSSRATSAEASWWLR
jgi:hypothetical protein